MHGMFKIRLGLLVESGRPMFKKIKNEPGVTRSKIEIALKSTGWQITYFTYIPTDHITQVRYLRIVPLNVRWKSVNDFHNKEVKMRTARHYVDQ